MTEYLNPIVEGPLWAMLVVAFLIFAIGGLSTLMVGDLSKSPTVLLKSPPLPEKPKTVINIQGTEDGFIMIKNISHRVMKSGSDKTIDEIIRLCEISGATQYDTNVVLINFHSRSSVFAEGELLDLYGELLV